MIRGLRSTCRSPGFIHGNRFLCSGATSLKQPVRGKGGKLRQILKNTVMVTAVLAVGGYGYMYATDEGTRRSAEFWRISGPIYAHYRVVQLLNRDLGILPDSIADPYYDELHVKYAPASRDITYSLRGFYLKNAQLLSTQDGFMPEPYMNWMKDTQDNVPSEFKGDEAKEYCAQKMKEELGLDFDNVFEWWDDNPLGVASIGQVHKARLRGSGQEVAVKLQFPNRERRFRADIKTIKDFCAIAMPQFSSTFDEIERQFITEFDYTGEARNLTEIRQKLMPKFGKYVEIPKAHSHLSSKHILVMDFLRGKKLVDGVRDHYKTLAGLLGTTVEKLEEKQKAEVEAGTFRLKDLDEESRQAEQARRAMLFKDLTNPTNIWRFFYNNFTPMPFLYPNVDSGESGLLPYEWSAPVLNLGKLLDVLVRVHGYQVFTIGAFNGDPHPGNILLLEDGRLGLIDYGQVKRLDVAERLIYAKCILAHLHYDREEVARLCFDECKIITGKSDRNIAYLNSAFWNDRDTDDVCRGMNIQSFLDWCQAQDPMIDLPDAYIFPGRVSVLLRGMGKAFGLKMRMSELWADEAQSLLTAKGVDYVPPICKTKKN